MLKQPVTAVKIGNNLTPETADVSLSGCRPAAQHAAVLRWHRDHPSAHWCANPFEPEPSGRIYSCSFAHTYFSAEGRLETIWVTPTGRIKHEPDDADDRYDFSSGPGGTQATIKRYGVFCG